MRSFAFSWKKGYDKLNRKDGEESLRKFVEKENIMQKILITNDDGIQSDGIIRLARAAKNMVKSGWWHRTDSAVQCHTGSHYVKR